jgi:threonine aldolase
MDFTSENTAPVHPAIVDAVVKANSGYATNFEAEAWTKRAHERLEDFFECDLSAFTVLTGTAANAIALGAMVPPYGAILCHWDAHIETDECGAPEMFTFGARQIPLHGEHGKLDPGALETYLKEARFGVVHALQPATLSLTQLTEAGTAYTPTEITTLTGIARRFGLSVHMDGARFANAVASLGATPAEVTWKAGIDIITLGTTKSGTFGAETIVSFKPEFAKALSFSRKRSGHLVPKSRFLGAQIEAYVENDLWLENARHANDAAQRLSKGLAAVAGVQIVHPTEGNEVFAAMPLAMTDQLINEGFKFHRDWRLHPRHNRFVMSWAASFDDIDALIEICKRLTAAQA